MAKNKISQSEWNLIKAWRTAYTKEQSRQNNVVQRGPVVWGYVRCSHQDSMNSGLGIDAQRRLIESGAERLRVDHPELSAETQWAQEPDPVSAYKIPFRQRPMGREIDRQLQRGDYIMFAYLDRSFRSTIDCLETVSGWQRRGVKSVFLNVGIDTDTPAGELTLSNVAAFAQFDSRMKSDRIKEVMGELKTIGRAANGHAPIGYKLVGPRGRRRAVVVDPDQRAVMAAIVQLKDSRPSMTWREVADEIELLLAAKEKRRPAYVCEKKKWSAYRCKNAYEAELEIRAKTPS